VSATKAFNAPLATVPYWSAVTFDASTANVFLLTLAGSVTSSALVSAKSGQILTFRICQDSAGAHSFTWPANFAGTGPVSQAASACSQQSFVFDGTAADAIGSLQVTGVPGGAITLPGTAGGTTVLQPAATAAGTLTLPPATDTLVARNTTDTLTNKTISGAANAITPTSAQILAAFSGCGGGKYLRDDGACGSPSSGSGGGPGVSASQATGTSVPANDSAVLSFDTNDWITDTGMHSTSTNPTRFIATSAGYYMAHCAWDVQNGNNVVTSVLEIKLNGAGVRGGTSTLSISFSGFNNSQMEKTLLLHMSTNDYVECSASVYQNGPFISGRNTAMQLVKLF
jgi:hypothetical protein